MNSPRPTRPDLILPMFAALLLVDVLALVLEKLASTHAVGEGASFYVQLIQTPWMWLGLGMGPIQLYLWKHILTRVEMGTAYALTSLCYPLTMIVSAVFLGEHLGADVWLGGLLITAGVALVNTRPREKEKAIAND